MPGSGCESSHQPVFNRPAPDSYGALLLPISRGVSFLFNVRVCKLVKQRVASPKLSPRRFSPGIRPATSAGSIPAPGSILLPKLLGSIKRQWRELKRPPFSRFGPFALGCQGLHGLVACGQPLICDAAGNQSGSLESKYTPKSPQVSMGTGTLRQRLPTTKDLVSYWGFMWWFVAARLRAAIETVAMGCRFASPSNTAHSQIEAAAPHVEQANKSGGGVSCSNPLADEI